MSDLLNRALDDVDQALSDCEEYFDNKADAEIEPDGTTHPNKEMRLQNQCYEALQLVKRLRSAIQAVEVA